MKPQFFWLAISFFVMVFGFNNCTQNSVYELSKSELSSLDRQTDVSFSEVQFSVDVNREKTIDLIQKENFLGHVQFDDTTQTFVENDMGRVDLLDEKKGKIRFQPAFGFRGSFEVIVKVHYDDYKQEIIKLIFKVANPLQNFKPALAVRATGCIFCHANIDGDIISDLGFKSQMDTTGKDLFFTKGLGSEPGTAFSVSHVNIDPLHPENSAWGTISILGSGKVVVPKVKFSDLPDLANRIFTVTRDYTEAGVQKTARTLAEYLDKVVLTKSLAPNTIVQEKNLVYIGAPSEAEIMKAGHLSASTSMNFVKNISDSPTLSGFSRVQIDFQDFYTNTPNDVMICEGDLFIDGVVWLRNLRIQTEEGCRIHVTKTVFITGPIEYVDESALTNLQITSARGIYMGMGMCYNCYSDKSFNNKNFFKETRSQDASIYTARGLRDIDNEQFQSFLMDDFKKISKEGPLNILSGIPSGQEKNAYAQDLYNRQVIMIDAASTYPDSSGAEKLFAADDISYRRLLLNAPDVQSRYQGNFQGTVIAQFAMWRLGKFVFKFDPVFKAVPIFPLLDLSRILHIE